MAGNSSRRGAVRKTSGGNPTAGSGGRVRRGLEGRGPTPKAEEREGHKAYRARQRTQRDQEAQQPGPGRGRGGPRPGAAGRRGAGRSGETEWVAGRNSVVEALRAGLPVSGVYVAEGAERDGRLREVFRVVADRGISLLEVGRGELDRMTGGAVHQGLAAKVPAYEYAHPDDLLDRAAEAGEPPLIVALDSVTDPRNLGAVVRSAAGFGAHGVVVPERRAAGMTAAAWKTSAGAAARVPVAMAGNLTRQLKSYQEAGCMVVGLAADGEVALPDLELADGPLVLVVGSEGEGMSRLVAATCDTTVSIPMASSLESLNAGVAAGIALYEVARHRSG
jgi:23S rRNA (guanosine2251-2'-O)-methyltransferase